MAKVNPYNFVSLDVDEPPDRSFGYPGRMRIDEGRYSGRLTCRLIALSPLISVDQRNKHSIRTYQLRDKAGQPLLQKDKKTCAIKCYRLLRNSCGQVILQSVSLKGMIRSVYEAITNSCLPLAATQFSSTKSPKENYSYNALTDYAKEACNDLTRLCPACRLFGTVTTSGDGEEVTCQGRVTFSDAILTTGTLMPERPPVQSDPPSFFLKVLGSPKPRHHATYEKNGLPRNTIAGRKFYYHHLPPDFAIKEEEAKRSVGLEELTPANCEFEFDIHIENLLKEELEDLILAIELEDGLAHKIGLGKAIGLGSCVVQIEREKSELTVAPTRYASWEKKPDTTWFSLKTSPDKLPDTLIEVMRINKLVDDGPIGYPSDYNNYPRTPINARGVFDGPMTAKPGRPPWPLASATEPPQDPAPVVKPDEEAAWLREIHDNELIFVNEKNEERRRPRRAFQGKQTLLKTRQWYVLKGSNCVEPIKK